VKNDVGDVLIPAVDEEVGVKDPLRLGDPGHDGVFAQLRAAGIWLASLAGVILLSKCRRRWRQKKMPPRRRATRFSEQARTAFVWFLILAVVWTKVLPHQMIAWLFTNHDER
jgi:predicted CDP-diglyceride synthetase/phosphatidate cytidylyltransferase